MIKSRYTSYRVSIGDVISLKEKSKNIELFKENFLSNLPNVYPYLEKDENSFSGRFTKLSW